MFSLETHLSRLYSTYHWLCSECCKSVYAPPNGGAHGSCALNSQVSKDDSRKRVIVQEERV